MVLNKKLLGKNVLLFPIALALGFFSFGCNKSTESPGMLLLGITEEHSAEQRNKVLAISLEASCAKAQRNPGRLVRLTAGTGDLGREVLQRTCRPVVKNIYQKIKDTPQIESGSITQVVAEIGTTIAQNKESLERASIVLVVHAEETDAVEWNSAVETHLLPVAENIDKICVFLEGTNKTRGKIATAFRHESLRRITVAHPIANVEAAHACQ